MEDIENTIGVFGHLCLLAGGRYYVSFWGSREPDFARGYTANI
jgi:hypothetical protein